MFPYWSRPCLAWDSTHTWCTLTRQSDCVHCVGFRWPKTIYPVPTPFYWWGPNLVSYSRPTVYAYTPDFVSSGALCRPLAARTPNFTILLTSAFCSVASWRQSEKVEYGSTTTNLPLFNGVKTVSILRQLHGEIVCRNSVVQRHDGHSNKQTKLNIFGRPGGGWNPSPTKRGTVIEDLDRVLTPPKRLGFDA